MYTFASDVTQEYSVDQSCFDDFSLTGCARGANFVQRLQSPDKFFSECLAFDGGRNQVPSFKFSGSPPDWLQVKHDVTAERRIHGDHWIGSVMAVSSGGWKGIH